MMAVPLDDTAASVKVATVLLVTAMLEIEAPETPEIENSVDATSDDHNVWVPVAVMVWEAFSPMPGGFKESDAVATVIVAELVPSEIVQVPVDEPVVMTIVAAVVFAIDCDLNVTPAPVAVNVVLPLTQFVPDPTSVTLMLPEWFAGTVEGLGKIGG